MEVVRDFAAVGAIHDNSMSGIVAAGASAAYIGILRQDIHELSLAFVAPLAS